MLNLDIGPVVMCADKKKEDNIELIFEMIKDNYQAFLDIIKNKKNGNPQALLSELLEKGIIELI